MVLDGVGVDGAWRWTPYLEPSRRKVLDVDCVCIVCGLKPVA